MQAKFRPTLSEEIAHSTIYHHLSQLSVVIQLSGLIKFREDWDVQMELTWLDVTSVYCLDVADWWFTVHWTGFHLDSTVSKLVKSCDSVSWVINTELSELLRLQPSELIASESVHSKRQTFDQVLFSTWCNIQKNKQLRSVVVRDTGPISMKVLT